MKGSLGCCCGLVAGCLTAILLVAAIGFGLYVYFNPDARKEGLSAAESAWTQVKTGVDDTFDRAKLQGEGAKEAPGGAAPAPPPEPEVPRPVVQPR